MGSEKDDLLELLDHVHARLRGRLADLTEDEWSWRPSAIDPDISLRWRLQHIVGMLLESRNWSWLGLEEPEHAATASPGRAADAGAALDAAYAALRSAVADPRVALDDRIGPAAGPYADATRRSFVLHIADELVHHGAEAALLRDLYAARRPAG